MREGGRVSRWAGEMEFEFIDGDEAEGGAFVATEKVVQFLRTHLAKGEVPAAVRLYEDSGANCAEALLNEAQSASSSWQRSLAEMFAQARDFKRAGQAYGIARELENAALFLEKGQDFEAAGAAYETMGNLPKAAMAFERAGKIEKATRLYEQAGPSDALAECLARQARYIGAAGIFRQLGNTRNEVDMLRLVPMHSEARVPAVIRLAELLEQFSRGDQAVGLLIDTIRQCEHAREHQPLYMTLAQLLEALGRPVEAAKVRERINNLLTGHVASTPAELPASTPAAAPVVAGALVPEVVTGAAVPEVVTGAPVAAPAPAPIAFAAEATGPTDPFANLKDPFDESGGDESSAADGYAHLKSIPIFAELDLGDMRDLYRACHEATIPAGATIIEQGVPGPGLVVVVQGRVAIHRVESNGQTTELAQLGAGNYVGEISLVDDAPTSARVVATENVSALIVPRDRFHSFLVGRDVAAMRMFRLFTRTLADRLRQANQR